jgi:hypothetical protein
MGEATADSKAAVAQWLGLRQEVQGGGCHDVYAIGLQECLAPEPVR